MVLVIEMMGAFKMNVQHMRRLTRAIALAITSMVFGAGNVSVGQDTVPPLIIPLTQQYLFNPQAPPSITVQLTAVDINTPSNELVWSDLLFASSPGKDPTYPDVSAITNPAMNSAGLLQWNLAGWNEGFHFLNAIVTNTRKNRSTPSTLVLTVQIAHIPEPMSATYVVGACLSVFGLARLRRRA